MPPKSLLKNRDSTGSLNGGGSPRPRSVVFSESNEVKTIDSPGSIQRQGTGLPGSPRTGPANGYAPAQHPLPHQMLVPAQTGRASPVPGGPAPGTPQAKLMELIKGLTANEVEAVSEMVEGLHQPGGRAAAVYAAVAKHVKNPRANLADLARHVEDFTGRPAPAQAPAPPASAPGMMRAQSSGSLGSPKGKAPSSPSGSLYGKSASKQKLAIKSATTVSKEDHRDDNARNVQYQEPPNMQFRRISRMKISTDMEKMSFKNASKSSFGTFFLNPEETHIVYCTTAGKEKKRFAIQDIHRVAFGGVTTTFTKRKSKKDRRAQWLCFSLILKDRTIDLVAHDEGVVLDWVLGTHALICKYRDPKEALWVEEQIGITPRARCLWRRFHSKLDFKAEVENLTRIGVVLEALLGHRTGRISKAWMDVIPTPGKVKAAAPTRQSSVKAWKMG